MSILSRFPSLSYITAAPVVAGLVVAFAPFTPLQSAYIATVVVGLGAVITSLKVNPPVVPVITGFAATALTGLASFGLHLGDVKIGALVALVGLVAGAFVHTNVSPTAP